jgi:hypothetical protein
MRRWIARYRRWLVLEVHILMVPVVVDIRHPSAVAAIVGYRKTFLFSSFYEFSTLLILQRTKRRGLRFQENKLTERKCKFRE